MIGNQPTRAPSADEPERRPLGFWRRMQGGVLARRLLVVAATCGLWQLYAVWLDSPLMFPSFVDTVIAWGHAVASGELIARTAASISLLVRGYAVGAAAAVVLTILAVSSRIGDDVLYTWTAMFSPLPGIALLPLALMWFGLGAPGMIFVLAHSVLWPLSLNACAGFRAVPETLRLVGRNYGFGPVRILLAILVPAALPAIFSGLRIGWA